MSVAPDSTRQTQRTEPPAHTKRWWTLGLATVLVLVLGSSWWIVRGDAAHEEKARPQAAAPEEGASAASALRLDVVKPRTGGLVRQTIQPGSVHAYESVDIFAKVTGFLALQTVDYGSPVKKGDVLAEIDAPELEKSVEEATAAVEQAKAQATLAEARVLTAESEREAMAAAVPQAEATIAQRVAARILAEKQLERIRGLHAREAVAKELVDEHEHSLQAAQSGESAARAAALMAKAQLEAAKARVHQARADAVAARTAVDLAEAREERARVFNGFRRLVAPFDGVVTTRYFHPGAFIQSATGGSGMPLFTVKRTDRMRVIVQVPDRDVALLDVGDPATILIDALKGQSFNGAVSRVAHAENPTTRTMRIEIDLENPSGLLCEGMYGRATIVLRPPSEGLSIPSACILGHTPDGKGKVYVVRDAQVGSTTVTLGDDDGTTTEILSGLDPDDQVVLSPRSVVEDGNPVAANLIPPADVPH